MSKSDEYNLKIEVINYVISIWSSLLKSNQLNNLYPINPGIPQNYVNILTEKPLY